jgi:threonine aldolase
MAKPRLVYVSQASELGTCYQLAELEALSAWCRAEQLLLMLDGARLGTALATSDVTLADLARLCDVFWIGGTKLGALMGEAIVVPNAEIAQDFAFHIKQRGGLLCKGRVLGVQFEALFQDGLYFALGEHANRMAKALAQGIQEAGYSLYAACDSNQIFAQLPNAVIEQLQTQFAFYVWEAITAETSVVRLVTSWATELAQVERFLRVMR